LPSKHRRYAGGITKTGDGVLMFSAQSLYRGATIVNGGGIRIGIANRRLSILDVESEWSRHQLESRRRLPRHSVASTAAVLFSTPVPLRS